MPGPGAAGPIRGRSNYPFETGNLRAAETRRASPQAKRPLDSDPGQPVKAPHMAIPGNYIFLPLLLQVFLAFVLYVALAMTKARASRAGLVDLQRRALHADAWPENVQKINNNIRNQFEVPVLFYILVVVLYQLGAAGLLAQALAWLFVASRLVHAYIHTGSNIVPIRRGVFMFGWLVILAMLVLAAVAVFR